MPTFSVPVVKIEKIEKHPNADSLSITEIEGCPVIFRTGDFQLGDLAIYLPIESMIPENQEWVKKFCSHLKFKSTGYHRLKAVRLRGIFSMGMVVPIGAAAISVNVDNYTKIPPGPVLGVDMSEVLGVKKWEEPDDDFEQKSTPRKPVTFWDHVKYAFFKLFRISNKKRKITRPMPVYDADHFRKNHHVLVDGEEVVATEKIHGCVTRNALISTPDGERVKISSLKEGDVVLGVDKNGRIVPATIVKKWDNGPATKWLKISGERRGLGRGSSFFSITCTPEHRFWNSELNDYIAAGSLEVGSKVTMLRSELKLTPIQEQVLLGKLLGDGSFAHNSKTAHVSFTHKEEHKEYTEWTTKALGDLCGTWRGYAISGYGTEMIRARTVNSFFIYEKFKTMINEEGTKFVPEWIASSLTPLALAFWYMDDGSLGHDKDQEDRCSFAVCGFTDKDCEVLLNGLNKFDIKGTFYKSDSEKYSRIRLNSEEADKLFLLIAPYIPACMQYKLPEYYRGHVGWIPSGIGQYKPTMADQAITAIEEVETDSARYDLETTTNNYFAHGILVHNSNFAVGYHKKRFWVSSHRVLRPNPDNSFYWRAVRKYDLEEKLKLFPDYIFYGEIFGPEVQDMGYGIQHGHVNLQFFDIYDVKAGKYLNYEFFRNICIGQGLPVVAEVYRGPYSHEIIDSLKDGPSPTATNYMGHVAHFREGVVVRPIIERLDRRCGRVSLKLVGEEYLLRKNGKEGH